LDERIIKLQAGRAERGTNARSGCSDQQVNLSLCGNRVNRPARRTRVLKRIKLILYADRCS
jgi:hypothetical protein